MKTGRLTNLAYSVAAIIMLSGFAMACHAYSGSGIGLMTEAEIDGPNLDRPQYIVGPTLESVLRAHKADPSEILTPDL